MNPSNRKTIFLVACSSLAAGALAGYYFAPLSLVINGKSVPGKTTTVAGATYVPVSALKAAGATISSTSETMNISFPAVGGANQVGAQEGGINDWLFDGIWRFRVTGVTPNDDGRPGWKVHVELRNGSKADNLALDGTGFDSLRLVMADGNALTAYNNVEITSKGVGQGGSIDVNLVFYDDDGAGRKPEKLILRIQPDTDTKNYMKRLGIGYTTADPSFRVTLKVD